MEFINQEAAWLPDRKGMQTWEKALRISTFVFHHLTSCKFSQATARKLDSKIKTFKKKKKKNTGQEHDQETRGKGHQ